LVKETLQTTFGNSEYTDSRFTLEHEHLFTKLNGITVRKGVILISSDVESHRYCYNNKSSTTASTHINCMTFITNKYSMQCRVLQGPKTVVESTKMLHTCQSLRNVDYLDISTTDNSRGVRIFHTSRKHHNILVAN